MSTSIRAALAGLIWKTSRADESTISAAGANIVADAILGSGLIKEERWVPVLETGERWAGRTKESAEQAMADYPKGFCYSDGAFAGGITHIEHEVRYVTEWEVVEP